MANRFTGWAVSIAAAICAGCGLDVRERALADIDLSDQSAVAAIGRQLPAREQTAFLTYALVHWPGSKSFCGKPMKVAGLAPATVGEAIAETIAFEAKLAVTRREATRPLAGVARAVERNRMLLDRYEELLLRRQMLATGDTPGRDAALGALDREIEQIKNRRGQLAL
ncbi:hypothetical protein ACWPM1_14755 [Tsuneonella sp. HG249]